MKPKPRRRSPAAGIAKCPTGIRGLDEITQGGLPRGRPTLVCGAAGCGKTLMAVEFIARGARDLGEPGVFMAFEETEAELAANVASLGFDLPALVRQKKVAVDFVYIERSEIEETGEYDLEGLFVRLGSMIDEVGAKRVALDSLEALFGGLPNEGILRAELRRLFRWLKDKGVTTVITGEQGENTLSRHGLEEYVSDCVPAAARATRSACSRRASADFVSLSSFARATSRGPFFPSSSTATSATRGYRRFGENQKRVSGVPYPVSRSWTYLPSWAMLCEMRSRSPCTAGFAKALA